MGKAAGVVTLIVVGLIVADIWTHPTGTAAVSSGVNSLSQTVGNQLIGVKAA